MKELKLTTLAIILGVCLIISTMIGAGTFYKVRAMDNTLTVTGSAKTTITSDVAKWSSSFSRTVTVDNIKSGYADMAKDLDFVKKFFAKNGIAEKDLTFSPVFMDEQYKYNSDSNAPTEYMLRQNVTLQSNDVAKVTELANNTQDMINNGVIFSPSAPEYYFTKLPETRISLLSDAVKDAWQRADKIAESSNKKVNTIKAASVGVTQVVPVNSLDISDYGAYDTSTIDKDVMITIKATFNMK